MLMNTENHNLIKRSAARKAMLLASTITLMFHTAAFAQTLPQTDAGTGSAPGNERDIVVTGSRTITNGNNSPTPVTIVQADEIKKTTPTTLSDALQKLPIFTGGMSVQNTGAQTRDPSAYTLSLRNFGAIRTLILQDGRRVPSSAADGTVNVLTMPEMFTKRVDVTTGGASAVYGSDAVTGVVNYVLDHDFTGLRLDAQSGVSSRGDDINWKVGIAAGTRLLDDRLHLEASYQHYDSAGIPDKLDRKFGADIYCRTGSGTAAAPYQSTKNCRFNGASFGGLITNGVAKGMEFSQNGILTPFIHGTPTASAVGEIGGSGTYSTLGTLVAELKSDQAFGRADYEFSDNLKGFVQVGYHRSTSESYTQVIGASSNLTYSTSNPFLSAAQQAYLSSGGASTFTMMKSWLDSGSTGTRATTRNISATAGLDGRIGDKWSWSLYYTHANTRTQIWSLNNMNNAKWAASLDAVVDPTTGNVVCNVSLTNPGLYPGCVPVNPFGPSSALPAGLSYADEDTLFTLNNYMDNVGGTIAGDLFELPAGPVKIALTGEYRRLRLTNDTIYRSDQKMDCTGLRFNCATTTQLWFANSTMPVDKAQGITEGAVEVNVPLLADKPWAEALDVNGAYRYAHYQLSGGASTWKIGVNWRPDRQLLLRATRSRDFRAPTLYDLFAPAQTNLGNFTDIHTNVNVQGILVESSGNPDLKPETSNTWTLGAVYTPDWLPRFSIAVDYYDIHLKDAITTVSGTDILYNNLCEQSGGTSPYCELYVRPLPFSDTSAANAPTKLLSKPLNLAEIWTRGLDVEANYSFALGNGNVSLRTLVSYQPVFKTIALAGQPTINKAGFADGNAKWRIAAFASYDLDAFSLSVQERWRSSVGPNSNTNLVFLDGRVPSVAYTDLSLSYKFKPAGHDATLFFTVQNLFDKQPPILATAPPSIANVNTPTVAGDDLIGQYISAGLRFKF